MFIHANDAHICPRDNSKWQASSDFESCCDGIAKLWLLFVSPDIFECVQLDKTAQDTTAQLISRKGPRFWREQEGGGT